MADLWRQSCTVTTKRSMRRRVSIVYSPLENPSRLHLIYLEQAGPRFHSNISPHDTSYVQLGPVAWLLLVYLGPDSRCESVGTSKQLSRTPTRACLCYRWCSPKVQAASAILKHQSLRGYGCQCCERSKNVDCECDITCQLTNTQQT